MDLMVGDFWYQTEMSYQTIYMTTLNLDFFIFKIVGIDILYKHVTYKVVNRTVLVCNV